MATPPVVPPAPPSFPAQSIPRRFTPKPAQIVGFGLWGPVALGGLFYMIGDPGVAWVQYQLGLTKPEEKKD